MEASADFPFISANIVDQLGNPVFKTSAVIERSGFRFGVTGAVATLPEEVEAVSLSDVVTSVNKVLADLEGKTDFQIVLFNGTFEEAKVYRPQFAVADYMFLSGVTDSPVGKMKNPDQGPRMYRLGKQGKSLALVTMNVETPGTALADITELKLREEFMLRQIERMKQTDPSKTLDELYGDNPDLMERAKKIQDALAEMQRELSSAVNTSRFDFPPMDKSLDDEPRMLGMVTETLAACDQLAQASGSPKSTGS
ncbi:MAG: hypothetical protein CMG71_06185 [Candidatus Marinimicrobia bacterium]|nr:hypothetical protein [Candidatus Neomarinimicrobiota bacterium]|tara:strand:- start:5351 stop:6109 length:759 start_codon:yes stop_codon:yes gene_type:complete